MAFIFKDNKGSFWFSPKTIITKEGREFDSYSGQGNVCCEECNHRNEFYINGLLKDTTKGKVYDLTFKPKNNLPF